MGLRSVILLFFIHRLVKMGYSAREEKYKGSAQAEPAKG